MDLYAESGVNTQLADNFVNVVKSDASRTYNENVCSGIGGFAALYKIDKDRYLASGTDGVGTKLKLALDSNIIEGLGQDLVAMCVNDIICTGANPLFFLDYYACGKLNEELSHQVLKGIVKGCKLAEIPLIGGETAEMPGCYEGDSFDLAGFAVGEVYQKDLVDGLSVKSGDQIVGIESSGFHSNGYSLIRKTLEDSKVKDSLLLEDLLVPTHIYSHVVKGLLEGENSISGIAHITGGGISNLARVNGNFNYRIHSPFLPSERADVFNRFLPLCDTDNEKDLYHTFNMGIGMCIVTENANDVIEQISSYGFHSKIIGEVENGLGKISLDF